MMKTNSWALRQKYVLSLSQKYIMMSMTSKICFQIFRPRNDEKKCQDNKEPVMKYVMTKKNCLEVK